MQSRRRVGRGAGLVPDVVDESFSTQLRGGCRALQAEDSGGEREHGALRREVDFQGICGAEGRKSRTHG